MIKGYGACIALLFALRLGCSVSQQAAYVGSSDALLEALNDDSFSTIVLTGDIVLNALTWDTVVISNRTVAINGTDAHHRINWNNISEAIVVEGDAGMEWHGVTWLQTPNPETAVPGNYSRYKMLLSQLWPSYVIFPGARIYYDHTFAITRSTTPFSKVKATFTSFGYGSSFVTINSTAYIVTGYHEQARTVTDLITNTTVGAVTLQLNNVTVIGAPDVAKILEAEDAGSGAHTHINWIGGILIALAVAIVLTSAFLFWLRCVRRKKPRAQTPNHSNFNYSRETEMAGGQLPHKLAAV